MEDLSEGSRVDSCVCEVLCKVDCEVVVLAEEVGEVSDLEGV